MAKGICPFVIVIILLVAVLTIFWSGEFETAGYIVLIIAIGSLVIGLVTGAFTGR